MDTYLRYIRDGCMEVKLIAPCGMNCGICMAYLREKNHCPGCRGDDGLKQPSCRVCVATHCDKREGRYCYDCPDMPCRRIKTLDKRYRTKYHMSMVDNLAFIKEHGEEAFLEKERKKWRCPECGGQLICHRTSCPACGKEVTLPPI